MPSKDAISEIIAYLSLISIFVAAIFWLIKTTSQITRLLEQFASMDKDINNRLNAEQAYNRKGFANVIKVLDRHGDRISSIDYRVSDLEQFEHKKNDFQPRRYGTNSGSLIEDSDVT